MMNNRPAIFEHYLRHKEHENLYVLVPYGKGARQMETIFLDYRGNDFSCMLGNNDCTGLSKRNHHNSQFVARNQVFVEANCFDGVFITNLAAEEGVVFVDDEPMQLRERRPLQTGQCFSLLGNIQWFNYVLMQSSSYCDMTRAFGGFAGMAIPSNSYTDKGGFRPRKNRFEKPDKVVNAPAAPNQALMEHLRCGICLDIMVEASTSQCGCNFCQNCIMECVAYRIRNSQVQNATRGQCPNCNKLIDRADSFPRNSILNSIIEEIVNNTHDQAIIQSYQSRL